MFVTQEKIDNSFLIDDLNDLLQLHLDVIEGYQSAIEKVRDSSFKQQLQQWDVGHHANIDSLSELIHKNGGEPRQKPDLAALTMRLRVAIAQIFHDEGLVDALRKSEQRLELEYERSLSSLAELPGMTETLQANADEVQARLQQLDEWEQRLKRPLH